MSFAKSQNSPSAGESLRARLGLQFDTLPRSALASGRAFRHGNLEVRWSPISRFLLEAAPWRDLIKRALEPNVFLEPAFAFPAAAHLEARDVGVLSVHAGSEMIALLAGRVENRPVPVFVAWTHPYAPLSGPLLDRQTSAETVPALMTALPELPGAPKAALFPLLPEAGVAARLIGLHLAGRGQTATRFNVHMRAALLQDEVDGPATVSPGKRKELRRQRRRLSELGHVEHEVASTPRDVRAAITDFVALEERGWKGRAGTAVARDSEAAQFMIDAVVGLAQERKARVDRLSIDGRTVAATIVLYSGDYAWFWKIAYDEELARYSPGVQIATELTDILATDRSLALVDSCAVADHPMIDHLWPDRIAIADWLVPLDGTASYTAAVLAERARRMAIAPLKAVRRRIRR